MEFSNFMVGLCEIGKVCGTFCEARMSLKQLTCRLGWQGGMTIILHYVLFVNNNIQISKLQFVSAVRKLLHYLLL